MRSILITNDDGITSAGIIRLAEEAKKFGEVWVIAPESQRSAMSHCITLHKPIEVYPHEFPIAGVHAYSCSGTPADCVRAGGHRIMPHEPDVVLSGINFGYNVATDLQYSATVGAAFEGAFQGWHSIALSEDAKECHEAADAYLHEILAELLDTKLGYGQILNVNFPGCPLSECHGILRDRRVSHGMFYRDTYNVIEELPAGGKRLMVEGHYNEDAEAGTDFRAVVENYISIGYAANIG